MLVSINISIFAPKEMKRICFLVDSIFTIGGVQRVTAVIAKALANDYDVTIVTQDQPSAKDTSLYGLQEAPIHYEFFRFPVLSSVKKSFYRSYSILYRTCLYRLRGEHDWFLQRWASDLYAHSSFPAEQRKPMVNILRQGNYDVIIGVHAPLAVRLAAVRKQLSDVRLIGWVHNSFEALFDTGSFYIGPERKRHYVYQLRKLDETIVLCQHDADSYRSYDSATHPRVIYNPLTLVPGSPSQGTSRQFLAVGRFSHRHKGFDLLIDAFSMIASECPKWTLHIVGEGVEESLYRQKMKDYGLEDRIFLHPFTTQIQQYYSQAQVYVLSSRWEGFGLVIVEAMAHGLPVVSSNLPTSKEIMGDTGLYFENGNVKELARRLIEATQLDWPAESAKAIALAQRFHISRIINQWHEIINKS